MRPRVWSRPARNSRLGWAIGFGFAALLVVAGLWLDRTVPPLVGRAQVIDGDTLRLTGRRVRLTGLDAPELDQTCVGPDGREWSCGADARLFLADLVRGSDLTCQGNGRDIYRRLLASCAIDGQDIGSRIVAAGWAQADLQYAGEETQARVAKRGIWSGTFVAPIEWRRSHGTAAPGFWEWIRSWFQ